MKELIIKNLHVEIDNKEILKGIDLTINPKEIHAIMGPNGNGKSTLLQTIMGHPKYVVTEGEIYFNGVDVLKLPINERSKLGIFLAMQYPQEIAGITNSDFLRAAINSRREKPVSLFEFVKNLENNIKKLKMNEDLAHRFLNEGFSGGEKKRNEILQMKLLNPDLAMLDEIDSGLDVDAIKIVASNILEEYEERGMSLMVVSHYERFYELVKPTHAHVLINGRIVESGDFSLVKKIDTEGYDWIYKKYDIEKELEIEPIVGSIVSCGRRAQ